eukprot:107574_1
MTPHGSVQFIKGTFAVGITIRWTYLFVANDCKFFIDHFIYFNQESVHNPLLKITCASFAGFYLWELCADKWGKLQWSTLCHHIVNIIVAIFVVFGVYNPFAIWYGYMHVVLLWLFQWDLDLHLVINMPNVHARNTFKFLFYFHIFACLINFGRQMYLLIYGIITNKIEIWRIATNTVACCIWGYDD